MSVQKWLARLIAHETTSHLSNLKLIIQIHEYLQALGFQVHILPNEQGDKAALFASISADMNNLNGGVCLSGHLDTVPTKGQDWHTNPFEMVEIGEKLYGRGTTDMKGFVACCLAIAPELAENPPKTPVHFCFSYDEEIGCEGVLPTITQMGKTLPMPSFTIVGEPTLMCVATAHKSIYSFETVLTGKAVHSSNPMLGVNTINAMRIVLNELHSFGIILQAHQNTKFNPAFSTLHVGVVKGGVAVNIVPEYTKILWEIRGLPQLNIQDYTEEFIQSLSRNPEFTATKTEINTKLLHHVPFFGELDTHEILPCVLLAARQIEPITVAFGTEAGHFEAAGIPTFVCGPGNISQAHTSNEFIEIHQLEACTTFLIALARDSLL